jgi:hypothetical protein
MSTVKETRTKYKVIVDGKSTFNFYSSELVDNMIYMTGDGAEYLCKGNEFIKLNSNRHDTHRNFNQI